MEIHDNKNNSGSNDEQKTKYNQLIDLKEPEILENWRKEQDALKLNLIKNDFYNFNLDNINNSNLTELKYIAGIDISASKHIENIAVYALVVCDRNLKIVYEDYKLVEMKEPYMPGFLAFR